MKYSYLIALLILVSCKPSQNGAEAMSNKQEFDDFIQHLEEDFIYRSDKQSIIDCIKDTYANNVDTITKTYYKVLYYEAILNELHDSHISLNTNTGKSYRLRSPIHVTARDDHFYIQHVFSSQLRSHHEANLINAVIEEFNGRAFHQVIAEFPSLCMDKSNPTVRNWIANKIVAGRRDQSRILTLRLQEGNRLQIDLDALQLKEDEAMMYAKVEDNIGYIRINNSLGNTDLVDEFDTALDRMMDTDALIVDLRNTPSGGNTDVAEPILGRFITQEQGYQICESKTDRYTRTVSPRQTAYDMPVYVLVGRWTGSMGEGMAVGLDGMNRATIVGTEMNRLAGGMKTIPLLNSNFGFHISIEKMYHLNGQLRETYVPQAYVNQSNSTADHHMDHAMRLIKGE